MEDNDKNRIAVGCRNGAGGRRWSGFKMASIGIDGPQMHLPGFFFFDFIIILYAQFGVRYTYSTSCSSAFYLFLL